MAIFGVILLKIALAFLFIVINAIILQHVSGKMKLEYEGFDNSTSIALVIGIVFFVVSFLPSFKAGFMLLGSTALPLILIKEFYKIDWKETLNLWVHWFIIYILVTAMFAFILALFM